MLQVKIKFRFKLFNLALIIHKLGLGDKKLRINLAVEKLQPGFNFDL